MPVASPDGSIAAVGRSDGSVDFWDVAGKRTTWRGAKGARQVAQDHGSGLTADKKTLVTADSSGEVKVWQLPSASYNARSLHTNKRSWPWPSVRTARRFATAGLDNIIKLWDRASGKELRQWDLHLPVLADPRPFVSMLVFTPSGKQLATGNADTTLYLLDCP